VYSIPVGIKEMLELSSLFSIAAKSLAGLVANGYLTYRFGLLAFIRDIKTLHGITTNLEYRIREYRSLLEKGYFSRKVKFGKDKGSFTESDVYFQSAYGVTIRCSVKHEWTLETWGTLRWALIDQDFLPLDELSRFNLAVKTIFDLGKIDALTLWELLPFTWLIDYFDNASQILASQSLRYRLQPWSLCVMRHYTHKASTTVTTKTASVSINNEGTYFREIKSRDVVTPPTSPSLSFDLLEADRWAVVLSLIAKFRDAGIRH